MHQDNGDMATAMAQWHYGADSTTGYPDMPPEIATGGAMPEPFMLHHESCNCTVVNLRHADIAGLAGPVIDCFVKFS